MRWNVDVIVMPKAGVNDPEGEAILGGLGSLGFDQIERVRAGRHFSLAVEAESSEAAVAVATGAANKLLANPVIQAFHVELAENGSGDQP